jgi:uncharacterized membrane protein
LTLWLITVASAPCESAAAGSSPSPNLSSNTSCFGTFIPSSSLESLQLMRHSEARTILLLQSTFSTLQFLWICSYAWNFCNTSHITKTEKQTHFFLGNWSCTLFQVSYQHPPFLHHAASTHRLLLGSCKEMIQRTTAHQNQKWLHTLVISQEFRMQQLDSSTQFFTNLLSSRCQSMNLLLHTTLHIPALVICI